MKKMLLILSLLCTCLLAGAQSGYRVMSTSRNTQYNDYVIVYGYYTAAGNFRMAHCRTNALPGITEEDVYSNKYYLDINTCTLKLRVVEAPVNVGPEVSAPASTAAPAF